MIRDLRFAIRSLARQPAFTLLVVVILALGIGATTAIFSVVNAVLLRDLPFADPDQLYALQTATTDGGAAREQVTPREIARLNDNHPTVQVAALTFRYENETAVMDQEGDPLRPLLRYSVTEKFFELFGVPMTIGRALTPDDFFGVVISYSMWRDAFGSDPSVVGSPIPGMRRRVVVGVAPEEFDLPRGTDLWNLYGGAPRFDDRRVFDGYVRLRAGTSPEQAQAELDVVSARLGREPQGAVSYEDRVFVLQPLLETVVGDLRPTLVILFGSTVILLFIACMNVTTLLLSRGAIRARQIALRLAIGAGRARIVRQLLTESLVLSAVGGALGLALSFVGVRFLLWLAPSDLPRLNDVGIDSGVLLFAVGSTLLTGLLVGLIPALRLAKTNIRNVMNEGGRASTAGPGRSRIFDILVVAEVGLAVLLVIGGGLLVLSYSNLTNTDAGFQTDRRLVFELNVRGRVDRETRYLPIAIFYRELLDRIRSVDGVDAVAATSTLPIGDQLDYSQMLSVFGDSPPEREQAPQAMVRQVTFGFFPTMGIRVVAGRGFAATDRRDVPGVAVINETFARRFFPGENPLGQRVNLLSEGFRSNSNSLLGEQSVDQVEVVGVVADVKYASLSQPAEGSLYLSHEQATFRNMTVVVRAGFDDAQSLIPAIRREISAMDPQLPVKFDLYSEVVRASIARERLGMTLLIVFGAAALLLATAGVYGVISASVRQRRGEIAVRSALGASAAQVLRLIMQRGVQLALAGVAAGVVGAVALRQILASQLYEIGALDLRVLLLVPVALLVVALLASFLPARRATKIDPADLLRTE